MKMRAEHVMGKKRWMENIWRFFVVYCLGASISYTPFIFIRHADDSITWRK